MLLSKEFIDFINSQELSQVTKNIHTSIDSLSNSFLYLKQKFADVLPSLYMNKETDKIKLYLDFGKEIDDFVEALNQIGASFPSATQDAESSSNKLNDETETIASDSKNMLILQTVKLGVVDDNLCPMCNVHLQDSKTSYTTFKDKSKSIISSKLQVFTYRCPNCNKYFIHKDMLATIDLDFSNLELMQYPKESKKKLCIQCGEPVFNNSLYCWEHYKYHHSESK